tara:strand:- start:212 stop:499 length:288 start_codon:yes stop_codon:yes gene_type:complete
MEVGRQKEEAQSFDKRPMNFQDWEKVKLNSLEILELEQEAHRLQTHEDPEHVARVCVGLLKQTRYQSKLLENAMNRIGFLEMELDLLRGKQTNHL